MWGTPRTRYACRPSHRFIPTHVGNSSGVFRAHSFVTVHPHACGELSSGVGTRTAYTGSSPRMWGTPDGAFADSTSFRFIPTHVGNSSPLSTPGSSGSVHPHACGELSRSQSCSILYYGSSPRMWGTREVPAPRLRSPRFIPTHVGNSPSPGFPGSSGSVHPHACGELASSARRRVSAVGSSPRMWGTLHVHHRRGGRDPVHPHACGELKTYIIEVTDQSIHKYKW